MPKDSTIVMIEILTLVFTVIGVILVLRQGKIGS